MWGYLYVTWFRRIFGVSSVYRSFATTVSQPKMRDFSGEMFKGFEVQQRHNCSPAASFANSVMTLYLLKVHLQTFLSIPITQKKKSHILSCDTLVPNEQYGVRSYAPKAHSFPLLKDAMQILRPAA